MNLMNHWLVIISGIMLWRRTQHYGTRKQWMDNTSTLCISR